MHVHVCVCDPNQVISSPTTLLFAGACWIPAYLVQSILFELLICVYHSKPKKLIYIYGCIKFFALGIVCGMSMQV